MNVNMLKGKFIEKGLSIEDVADAIYVDRSTLYRKLNNQGDTLTIKEANMIVKKLNLTSRESTLIFFSNTVA